MKAAITIHNYEQYFLLHADGELSPADEQAVLQFVKENPHLAGEFEMLQQLKLPVEPVVFFDKEVLYKNGAAEISLDNYEAYFLLYVDNELTIAERVQVETFVLQHPGLQEQFLLLKQTQLQPEEIVFADKASLYRKEEKERPVIFMRWQRVAVAAALMGVAVTTWFLLPGNNEVKPGLMADRVPHGVKPYMGSKPQVANPATNQSEAVENDKNTTAVAAKSKPVLPQSTTIQPEQQVSNPVISPDPAVLARIDAEPVSTAITGDAAGSRTPVQAPRVITASNDAAKILIDNTINNQPEKTTAGIAQPAVYKELDTEDENKSLYVGSLEINKDKLRGFFRKATSLFRGKAKQQEEEKAEATPSSSNTRSLR